MDSIDDLHKNDTAFFVSVFALLRIAVIAAYIWFDVKSSPPIY